LTFQLNLRELNNNKAANSANKDNEARGSKGGGKVSRANSKYQEALARCTIKRAFFRGREKRGNGVKHRRIKKGSLRLI
jgi:hypothetical protein